MSETNLATTASKAMVTVPNEASMAVVMDNMDGQITSNDLIKIKFPSSGAVAFEVPTLEGLEYQQAIDGVIIAQQLQNVYWEDDTVGSGTPPDCAARDGRNGEGNPGGECAVCPFNKFGTARKGGGKACQNKKVIFVLRPNSILPIAISVPPSSLGVVRSYMTKFGEMPYYSVVTRFSLEKAVNADGNPYSKLVLATVPLYPDAKGLERVMLPADTVTDIKAYRDALLPQLQAAGAVIEQDAQ